MTAERIYVTSISDRVLDTCRLPDAQRPYALIVGSRPHYRFEHCVHSLGGTGRHYMAYAREFAWANSSHLRPELRYA